MLTARTTTYKRLCDVSVDDVLDDDVLDDDVLDDDISFIR
jgi:hypothetical protein